MITIVLTAVAAILLLVLFFKIISAPIKLIFKILLNTLAGFVILVLVNIVSGFFDFSIPINFLNMTVVGIMGIPGAVLLVILKLLM